MNIPAKVDQIFIPVYSGVSEAALKQRTAPLTLTIHRLNIRIEDCIDEARNLQVTILPYQEMIMVRHETIGNYGNVIFFMIPIHQKPQMSIVAIIEEDRFSVYPPVE